MRDPVVDASAFVPQTVVSLIYHTVASTLGHPEGEEYTIADPLLCSTVYGCGFADIVGDAPAPPPPGTQQAHAHADHTAKAKRHA